MLYISRSKLWSFTAGRSPVVKVGTFRYLRYFARYDHFIRSFPLQLVPLLTNDTHANKMKGTSSQQGSPFHQVFVLLSFEVTEAVFGGTIRG